MFEREINFGKKYEPKIRSKNVVINVVTDQTSLWHKYLHVLKRGNGRAWTEMV